MFEAKRGTNTNVKHIWLAYIHNGCLICISKVSLIVTVHQSQLDRFRGVCRIMAIS